MKLSKQQYKEYLKTGDIPYSDMEYCDFQIITLPYLMPGLNGNDGLKREHYRKGMDRLEKTKKDIKIYNPKLKSHIKEVDIVYRRFYCGTAMDWDNAYASFKYIGDALVHLNVIKDDKPSIVKNLVGEQIRVNHRHEQKTEILIKSL